MRAGIGGGALRRGKAAGEERGVITTAGLAPETILVNGKVLTLDERFAVAQAVAVQDAGEQEVPGSGIRVSGQPGHDRRLTADEGRDP